MKKCMYTVRGVCVCVCVCVCVRVCVCVLCVCECACAHACVCVYTLCMLVVLVHILLHKSSTYSCFQIQHLRFSLGRGYRDLEHVFSVVSSIIQLLHNTNVFHWVTSHALANIRRRTYVCTCLMTAQLLHTIPVTLLVSTLLVSTHSWLVHSWSVHTPG